jgi:hypothetical protein
MGGSARLLILAATAGLMVTAGAATGAAQPDAGPAEVPMPRIVIADATCDLGGAKVTVWIDETGDKPLHVRLNRLRPDQATQTRDSAFDSNHIQHKVVFEPVSAGDYLVHVDGLDGPQDDVPVVVKPCGDQGSTGKPLAVEVACKAGWGLVTFTVANSRGGAAGYDLLVGGFQQYRATLGPGVSLRVAFNAFDDQVDDGDYTAVLKAGKDVVATEKFKVTCAAGNAPTLDITAQCDVNTARVSVGVLNPNRATIDYTVALKGQTQRISVAGGGRGTVTFAGIPNGDNPVQVSGGNTGTTGMATVKCGAETTTTTPPPTTTAVTTLTTTAAPVPQGRSGGLASTGVMVGALVGLGALALLLGVALRIMGRWRARRD